MNFGTNMYNWIMNNASPLYLGALIVIGVWFIVKLCSFELLRWG